MGSGWGDVTETKLTLVTWRSFSLIRDVNPESCGDPGSGSNPGCLQGGPRVWFTFNPSRTLLMLMSHCPGWVYFFVVRRPFLYYLLVNVTELLVEFVLRIIYQ